MVQLLREKMYIYGKMLLVTTSNIYLLQAELVERLLGVRVKGVKYPKHGGHRQPYEGR